MKTKNIVVKNKQINSKRGKINVTLLKYGKFSIMDTLLAINKCIPDKAKTFLKIKIRNKQVLVIMVRLKIN